jgi:hypothetical protein
MADTWRDHLKFLIQDNMKRKSTSEAMFKEIETLVEELIDAARDNGYDDGCRDSEYS